MSPRQPDAGVTLIEMMVALALFALIASAGFALLDTVLRSQRSTEGRLDRLSQHQRALQVITSDMMMALPHSLRGDETLSFDRSGSLTDLQLRYRLADGVLWRDIATTGAPQRDQALLRGVSAVTWRFLTPEGDWSDIWPVDPTLATPRNPRAVDLVIQLADHGGQLRRVAPLPADLQ
jgi:general secretion pathway protein J